LHTELLHAIIPNLIAYSFSILLSPTIHYIFVSAPECRDIETALYNRTSVCLYIHL